MSLPTALSHPCYHDDDAARITFESVRWPNGPYCPHCGAFDTVAPLGGESMGSVTQSAAEGPMVRRLAAGGRWIRTSGSASWRNRFARGCSPENQVRT